MSFENAWQMYNKVLDRRRQREQDNFAREKYEADQAYRAQQQANYEQEKRRLGVIDAQGTTEHNARMEAHHAAMDEKRFNTLANQTEQFSHRVATQGAEAVFSDPTYRPVVANVMTSAMQANGDLPEGYTVDFEQIVGPTKDGKGTNLWVPLITTPDGNQVEIGQFLNDGNQAMSFSADQIASYLQNVGQKNRSATTNMGVAAMAKAPEDNAGEPQTLGDIPTPAQPQPQPQPQTEVEPQEPALEAVEPTPDVEVGVIEPETTIPADPQPVLSDKDAATAAIMKRLESEFAPDGQDSLSLRDKITFEDKALETIMKELDVNRSLARHLHYRHVSGKALKEAAENQGSTKDKGMAYNVGRHFGKKVDAYTARLETAVDGAKAAGGAVADIYSDVTQGFSESDDLTATNVSSAGKQGSLNDRTTKQQEEAIKNSTVTAEDVAQNQQVAFQTALENAGKPKSKRPTKKQREERARTIAIRRAAGESITAQEADRYINTGYVEKLAVQNVVIGGMDVERVVHPDGTREYIPIARNETARKNMVSEQNAREAKWEQERKDFYEAVVPTAMARAGEQAVIGEGEAAKQDKFLGLYMDKASFHLDLQLFVQNHAGTLEQMMGYNFVKGPLDLGAKRALENVATAYAAAVRKSTDSKGRDFSQVQDFSAFIKETSAESGLYVVGNKIYNIDEEIDKAIQRGATSDRVALREQLKIRLEQAQKTGGF